MSGRVSAFLPVIDDEEIGLALTCSPEALAAAPVIETSNRPFVSPQEWDCGCVAETVITSRDALLGEEPFEMRLTRACAGPCARQDLEGDQ